MDPLNNATHRGRMPHEACVFLPAEYSISSHSPELRVCIAYDSLSASRGGTIPSSRRRDVRPLAAAALPLGAGMRSAIDPNVFAVHHRSRLQIEQRIHDLGELHQARNGMELLQGLVIVVCVHRR